MSWTGDDDVKGREAYKMENVGDYRKVDTEPKKPDEIDGRVPSMPAPEFVRSTNDSLEERFGDKAPDSDESGKY